MFTVWLPTKALSFQLLNGMFSTCTKFSQRRIPIRALQTIKFCIPCSDLIQRWATICCPRARNFHTLQGSGNAFFFWWAFWATLTVSYKCVLGGFAHFISRKLGIRPILTGQMLFPFSRELGFIIKKLKAHPLGFWLYAE